jgi:hypothetical protein
VRQPTGPINLNETFSFFMDIADEYGLDDYDRDLDIMLPAALNVTDFDKVVDIVDGALNLTVELTLLRSSSDICDASCWLDLWLVFSAVLHTLLLLCFSKV